MTQSNLEPLADALGQVRAQISELETREKNIKAQIVEAGVDALEGAFFRVLVLKSVRHTLDSKAAREMLERLGASPQWFAGNTKRTDVTTLKCAPRSSIAA